MPNKIKPRRSYTAGATPTTSDLDTHELAINWTDGKAFTKNAAGSIVSVTLGDGGGLNEDAGLRALFVPPPPTGLTVTAGNASAILSWTAPTGVIAQAPITDYREQYSTDGGTTWTTFTGAAASTATTATVTGLTNGQAVRFRVAAVNAVGVGAYTAASSAVTPVAGDPLFGNVALLLHMDGTGSTFADSSPVPKTITANGNATQSTAQSKFGGKSAAFDGSGDYLTTPSIALGSGDFVVECQLYLNAISSDFTGIFDCRPSQGAFPCLLLNGSAISWFVSESFRISGSSLSTGQWYHIAVARASGSTRMYVNGTQVGSTYSDSNNYGSRSAPVIGALFDGLNTYALNGFIDEFRVTVGNNRGYTGSTITVPTAAFPEASPGTDPLFSSVSLLLHADGTGNTFTDSSGTPKTITASGNATQSTAQSQFGGKSAAFDGSGDWIATNTSAGLTFGAGDFTIEFWARPTGSQPANPRIIGNLSANAFSTGDWALTQNLGFGLYAYEYESGGSPIVSLGSSLTNDTWAHVAIVRSGSEWSMYKDGTRVSTNTWSGSLDTGTRRLVIGSSGSTIEAWNGYIDELRVTKAARYTGSTITVPAAAFPDS
jgi:hypothetical protein